MKILVVTFAITLALIPGVILRYLPFSKLLAAKQKKHLMLCYILCFITQNIAFFTILKNTQANPAVYKTLITIGGILYLFVNLMMIKNMFFQHLFILGMVSNYALVLHSFSAIVLSQYVHRIPPHRQLIMQTGIYLLLLTLSIYPVWRLLKHSFIFNISREDHYYWHIIWLIPFLLYIGNTVVTMNSCWINTWQQLVARITTGSAALVAWKTVSLDFKTLQEKLFLQSTNKLLHIQIEGIKQQAQTIHENNEKMHILRHDMRHHVQVLSSLIHSGELSAASSLLAELSDNLQSIKPIAFCNNPVINSALLVYISKAKEEHILVTSEVAIPQDIPWNSNDIAILFANVLENAIHASRQQKEGHKEIHIFTKYDDQKLGIEVKNRFEGEILFNDHGMPISLEKGHGIGMSSIHAIVSKYRGSVICSHADHWFTIRFMFSECLLTI
ncbi:hypothetical protein CS063_01695 [Sporanaerobium hydrogeniformans]|uniref:Uncharacterized protein n=1 Tax=Sporanaerobium hydrogeniformans TaxID=3072179 RepID=A0AC61DG40_9FIRM|nr:GHKL domain-containing protein [Sporanaerobium hydrogeniformans]PHV72214.1 hypothetical protein CS063_01695 [Sporanaerobium hydrogeniformans]